MKACMTDWHTFEANEYIWALSGGVSVHLSVYSQPFMASNEFQLDTLMQL